MTDKPIPPMWFTWDGEALWPRYARLADKHLVIGQQYRLVEHHDRSEASHRHYFACVHEAWSNLGEEDAIRFPTAEHLRKYALIRTRWRDQRAITVESEEKAAELAALIKPLDDFAVIIHRERTVWVLTAKSQSMKAMNRHDFQASKNDVLDLLAPMIGVTRAELEANAGAAA